MTWVNFLNHQRKKKFLDFVVIYDVGSLTCLYLRKAAYKIDGWESNE